jgi:galactose mutarotase-like enzyme
VLEYNARFPVGAEWVMPYNPDHHWQGGDFFGASLTSFVNLLNANDYKLVACSVQGSNAFFVNQIHGESFQDISMSVEELYQPPLYYLVHQWAQKASPATIKSLFD